MSEKQVRDYDKFMLRLPEGMREAIAERAKFNGRSMNSEIVQILQDALDLSPEQEVSGAIDRAYFAELEKMSNDDLENWFKAIKENTKALNESTKLIVDLKRKRDEKK
ncbi:Arc family DNA-binding protein [Erwinia phyllosphaerae]|uniref:Arc family DNA-binding protein n=1 Tax=Erwinia phyllosphaerae TaxID=2853256 RepID=UPI0024857D2C|nr:Arc family DNA-binding protein [Erwinia phyllosphaerae]MBV4365932.1 Arc family DNA-binding protein [Erwinia phyllosphaerae]